MHLPPLRSLRRRACSVLTAAIAVAGTLTLSPVASAQPAAESSVGPAAGPAVPGTPTGLPDAIEGLASYVPANSCDPHAKPGTTALGDLLKATYPGSSYGIDRTCGTDPLPTSEHYDGRALDFFRSVRDPQQRAQIQALVQWLFATDADGHTYANARRLGVMYLIWDNRIWGSYRAAEGWRPYMGCAARTSSAYDTTCHRDHIHISLSWEGAMKRTSFWTGQAAARDYGPCREPGLNWAAPYTAARTTPCAAVPHVSAPAQASPLARTLTTYSGMTLGVGDTGPVVSAVQQAVGAGPDGVFGPLTQAAVSAWQASHGLAATGVVTADTWRALLAAFAAPVSRPAAPTHPGLTRYATRTLRVGSHGAAVTAVQHRLHMHPARGTFGRRTQARVRLFQSRHHLVADGIVGPSTWAALAA